ncbi:MAG: HAMP domain-containing sensor histidine kinase [Phycisphaerales bacterium]
MSEQTWTNGFSVSIRLKIMLLIVAIVVVIQGTLSVVVLLYQRDAVRSSFDADLEQRLDEVALELEGAPGDWSQSRLEQVARREAGLMYFEGVEIAIYARDNTLRLASFGELDDVVLAAFEQLAATATQSARMISRSITSESDSTRMPLRLACKSFTAADGERYALCFVTSDVHAQQTVRRVGVILLLAFPMSVFAVAVSSWFVGGLAVRPLADVHHFAENVREGSIPLTFETQDHSSEMIELKSNLEDAMRRVRDGYARQARFLSNVSHELKTPISVILAESAALLAHHDLDERTRGYVRSTAEEMRRLGKLVESFLLLSRIQEGKRAIRPRLHTANDVLMDALDSSRSFAKQMGVPLRTTLAEAHEDLLLLCNTELYSTAIANIIRNAVRFTPEGEAVEISVDATDENVLFRIRDFGPGIPDDLLGRLFKPYEQSNDEAKRKRGTGLGLQIALGIAEIHGGTIRVENRDPGCEFTLLAPRHGHVSDDESAT